ncbi:MAG: ABC transporter ATP-binding protein/permease [Lentimicrobiaceae bacterium]|nr:ABC transporter ATP-binding protein/permease [Lentimicrobiaceae bacterium]
MKEIGKILKYVNPYWGLASLNILFNVLSVVFSLFSVTMAIPFLQILFDKQDLVTHVGEFSFSTTSIKQHFYYFLSQMVISNGKASALGIVCIIVVIMTFFKTWFRYLAMYFLAPIRNGIVMDIREKIFRKVLNLPLSYFTDEKKGDIMSRMTNDVKEIEWSILSSLEVLFRDPLTIAIYLVVLVVLSPTLSLFVFILLPFTSLVIGRLGKNLRKRSKWGQEKVGGLLSIIDETLGGMRIVKAFTAEEKMKERFTSLNVSYTNLMNKVYRRTYLATPLTEFLGTAIVVLAMWYGGSLVLSHSASLNAEILISYLLVFAQIINPAKSFSTARYNIKKGLASADRVNEVLNSDDKIVEKPDAKPVSGFSQMVEYRNVSFKYEKEYVLKNINLKVEKGKTIALVGQSGSGKSTLVDLLPRFYDVDEGGIYLDGISIRDYKIADLRCLMGIVNQEPILFNDTIYNNIAFGAENVTYQEVEAAACIANAHDFIMNTEEGYDTNIGERGQKLSGGQRQRISIARAILKNPPILILDEATSALDTESEKLVQDALSRVMENRTSLVIAHRLSTVHDADEICVLHEGEIVERGTHDELLKNNGIYKKLYSLQVFE